MRTGTAFNILALKNHPAGLKVDAALRGFKCKRYSSALQTLEQPGR